MDGSEQALPSVMSICSLNFANCYMYASWGNITLQDTDGRILESSSKASSKDGLEHAPSIKSCYLPGGGGGGAAAAEAGSERHAALVLIGCPKPSAGLSMPPFTAS